MDFLNGHEDAVIAAGAAVLGMLSQVPLSLWARRATERHERRIWLRDRYVSTIADVTTGARQVRAAFEEQYERWRADPRASAPGTYRADAATEASFTGFMRALDVARLVPDPPEVELAALDEAVRWLVKMVRWSEYDVRRPARDAFDAALDALLHAVRSELA